MKEDTSNMEEESALENLIDRAKDVNFCRDALKKKIKETKNETRGVKKTTKNICRLKDPMLIVAPHDKGEPPSWVPAWHGEEVVWVERELFEKLKKLRNKKPCDVCPEDINKKCERKK